VFVDWSQNDEHKTTICAYSLRGRARPLVSTPVSWDEVSDALDDDDPDALTFEAPEVLERVERFGDLYAPNLALEQELPSLGPQRTRRS
jgi:bifunctional non-homologous end joining protein LigD